MRAFGTVAAVGVAGVLLFKTFTALFLPLAGALLGFFGLALKIAFFVTAGLVIVRFIKRRRHGHRS